MAEETLSIDECDYLAALRLVMSACFSGGVRTSVTTKKYVDNSSWPLGRGCLKFCVILHEGGDGEGTFSEGFG